MTHGAALVGGRHGGIGPQVAAADARPHHPYDSVGGLVDLRVGPVLDGRWVWAVRGYPGALWRGSSLAYTSSLAPRTHNRQIRRLVVSVQVVVLSAVFAPMGSGSVKRRRRARPARRRGLAGFS